MQVSPLTPGTHIGDYEVVEHLGGGGFGTVYEAASTVTGDRVAVKLLHHRAAADSTPNPELTAEALDVRFRREVQALLNFRHPNVVQVHGFGYYSTARDPYLVMELVDGWPLYRWRAERRPSLQGIVRAMRDVAGGLAHIHGQSTLHRDLKSDNILVRRKDERAVLVDFGLAKPRFLQTITRAGTSVGTYEYLSPEYVGYILSPAEERDGRVYHHTPADDLYALGVVFYELLVGKSLFTAENDLELLVRLRDEPLPPLSTRCALPDSLGTLFDELLSRDPAQRPEAARLEARLEDLMGNLDDSAPWAVPVEPSSLVATPADRPRAGRASPEASVLEVTSSLIAEVSPAPLPSGPGAALRVTPQPTPESAAPRSSSPPPSALPLGSTPAPAAPPAGVAATGFRAPSPLGEAAGTFNAPSDLGEHSPTPAPEEPAGLEIPSSLKRLQRELAPRRRVHPLVYIAGGTLGLLAIFVVLVALGDRSPKASKPANLIDTAKKDLAQTTQPEAPPAPAVAPAALLADHAGAPSKGRASNAAPRPRHRGHRRLRKTETVAAKPTSRPAWMRGSAVVLGDQAAKAPGPKQQDAATRGPWIPAGTKLSVRLTTGVATSTGGPVEARLTGSYLRGNSVLLPRGTRLQGAATELSSSRVGLTFTEATLPDGRSFAMRASARGADGSPGIAAPDNLTTGGGTGRPDVTGTLLDLGTSAAEAAGVDPRATAPLKKHASGPAPAGLTIPAGTQLTVVLRAGVTLPAVGAQSRSR